MDEIILEIELQDSQPTVHQVMVQKQELKELGNSLNGARNFKAPDCQQIRVITCPKPTNKFSRVFRVSYAASTARELNL